MDKKEAVGGFLATVCVAGERGGDFGNPGQNQRGQFLQLREEYDPVLMECNIVVIGIQGQIGYLEPQSVMILFQWKKAGLIPKCYYYEKLENGTFLVYLSQNEAAELLV